MLLFMSIYKYTLTIDSLRFLIASPQNRNTAVEAVNPVALDRKSNLGSGTLPLICIHSLFSDRKPFDLLLVL